LTKTKSSSKQTCFIRSRYERGRFILLLSFILISGCGSAKDLTIYYTGNLYGTLEDCGCPKESEGSVLNHITFYKDSIKSRTESPVYLSAGNLFAPNRGDRENLVLYEITHSLGYDFMFPGKSELNLPDTVKLPAIVSLNLKGSKDHFMVKSGRLKIAVTGMTDPEYKRYNGRNDLQNKTIEEIKTYISGLKKKSDIVVFISNLESGFEKEVFNEVKDIGVMISNTNFGKEEYAFGERLYLSHGMFGEYIGKLTIRNNDGVASLENIFTKMDNKSFKEDPEAKIIIDSLKIRYGIDKPVRDDDF
jgi:hypothetical protein